MTPRRSCFSRGVWVETDMPSATGVVQEAGVPARPAISTRQSRQEPKASPISVAHSLGTWLPPSLEASLTEAPSGTVTLMPSMVRLSVLSALLAWELGPTPSKAAWFHYGFV